MTPNVTWGGEGSKKSRKCFTCYLNGPKELIIGPIILAKGFPFVIQSYECHCPYLMDTDCDAEERFQIMQTITGPVSTY
jgi:hypothetical protein